MVADSERYLEHVRQSGGKYFGIMVRVQRAYLKMKSQINYKATDGVNFMKGCAKNLSNLEELRNNKNWDRTLANDLGNFGSCAYRHSKIKKRRKKFCMMTSSKLCMATGGLLKSLRIALQSTLALTVQPILHKYNAQLQQDLTVLYW